jgi:hypothetical protein
MNVIPLLNRSGHANLTKKKFAPKKFHGETSTSDILIIPALNVGVGVEDFQMSLCQGTIVRLTCRRVNEDDFSKPLNIST